MRTLREAYHINNFMSLNNGCIFINAQNLPTITIFQTLHSGFLHLTAQSSVTSALPRVTEPPPAVLPHSQLDCSVECCRNKSSFLLSEGLCSIIENGALISECHLWHYSPSHQEQVIQAGLQFPHPSHKRN